MDWVRRGGSGAMCLCEIKQKIKLHLQSIYLLMDGRNHRIMIIFTCKSQQTNSETSGIFISQLKMVFSSNIWMHWPWIQKKKILMIIHQCLWFLYPVREKYTFYLTPTGLHPPNILWHFIFMISLMFCLVRRKRFLLTPVQVYNHSTHKFCMILLCIFAKGPSLLKRARTLFLDGFFAP